MSKEKRIWLQIITTIRKKNNIQENSENLKVQGMFKKDK